MMSDMHDNSSIKSESVRIIRCRTASKLYPYVATIEDTGDRRPLTFDKRNGARPWTVREATAWIANQPNPDEYTAEDPADGLSDGPAFE